MQHDLKIQQCFLIHILEGRKPFEIRKNDRDFQVGDTISFLPLNDEKYDVYREFQKIPHFKITYVLSGFCGLQQGHVALTIEPIGA